VPPFTRGFDPGVRVSPPPRNAIERFRITDAISFAAVRVPHAIQPVSFPDDTGPSECILGAIREIDAHDAVTAPVQAVGRLSVSDVIVVFWVPPLDRPLDCGDVPHSPQAVLDDDPRRRRQKRVDGAALENRSWRQPREIDAVLTHRQTDIKVKGNGNAQGPPGVIEIALTLEFHEARARHTAFVEAAQRSWTQNARRTRDRPRLGSIEDELGDPNARFSPIIASAEE